MEKEKKEGSKRKNIDANADDLIRQPSVVYCFSKCSKCKWCPKFVTQLTQVCYIAIKCVLGG